MIVDNFSCCSSRLGIFGLEEQPLLNNTQKTKTASFGA
jgi:hypothetical protein